MEAAWMASTVDSDGADSAPFVVIAVSPPASRSAGRREDGREVGAVLVVVIERLVDDVAHVIGVLDPARLGDDGQGAAQLARDGPELLAHLGQRSARPVRLDLGVDDFPTASLP